MKKALILTGLLLISALSHAQQDNESGIKDKSLTISIAPSFFATLDENLDADTFWPKSFYITKNFTLKSRLSFSTGIHFLYKRIVEEGFVLGDFVPGYSGPTKVTNKYSIFDIPLRLNYHILKPNDKLNLYAKAEMKNSLIINYIKYEPNMLGKHDTHSDTGYDMFLGVGFGFNIKLVDRFSFVIEPGFNYSVIGLLPQVGLFDCQLGVKYNLTKK